MGYIDSVRDQVLPCCISAMKEIPCTQCGKCLPVCPAELDIPGLMEAYNRIISGNTDEDGVFVCSRSGTAEDRLSSEMKMSRDAAAPYKLPSLCVGCGQCMFACPEGIGIPAFMHELVLLDI